MYSVTTSLICKCKDGCCSWKVFRMHTHCDAVCDTAPWSPFSSAFWRLADRSNLLLTSMEGKTSGWQDSLLNPANTKYAMEVRNQYSVVILCASNCARNRHVQSQRPVSTACRKGIVFWKSKIAPRNPAKTCRRYKILSDTLCALCPR